MKKLEDKLLILFKICIYSFAVFGVVICLSYIFGTSTQESASTTNEGINQIFCYISGATIGIIMCAV